MTMTRLSPGPRMSEAVTLGDIVFLAGQVPDDLTADITVQTQQVLANIDAVLAQLGGTKADIASASVAGTYDALPISARCECSGPTPG